MQKDFGEGKKNILKNNIMETFSFRLINQQRNEQNNLMRSKFFLMALQLNSFLCLKIKTLGGKSKVLTTFLKKTKLLYFSFELRNNISIRAHPRSCFSICRATTWSRIIYNRAIWWARAVKIWNFVQCSEPVPLIF